MPKRILSLSESQVEDAQAKGKDYKLSDGFGLHLLVRCTGHKLWRFQYRYSGKQKLLALGVYPAVSLDNARALKDVAKKQLADGLDPMQLKKELKISQSQREASRFDIVALKWHEQFKSEWSTNYAINILKGLQHDVFPFIGNNNINEIESSHLLAVLHRIELRSSKTAQRMKTAMGGVFCYAVETGSANNNPMEGLRRTWLPPQKKHFVAPAAPRDLASLLLAIDGYEGSFVVKCAMRLSIFLLVEPENLRHAQWGEIDFLEELWAIPAQKRKPAQFHIIPLARQVIRTLRELNSLAGHSRFVFPSFRTQFRCLSQNAINAGLGGLGFGRDAMAAKWLWEVARVILPERSAINTDHIEHHFAGVITYVWVLTGYPPPESKS